MSRGENRKFGVVLFDDDKDPATGWAAVAGSNKGAVRISGSNDLSTDTIWWTNISYDWFFRKTESWRSPWLRHDKYLVVSPTDVLREWGYDPKTVGADFMCKFSAEVFGRIMHISFKLLKESDPRVRMDTAFTGKTLREDLRCLLPEPEYPQGEAAAVMKSGQAWEEFTVTTARGIKGGKWVMLRKPRILYAMEMLQTPIPKGPFEFMSRGDIRSKTSDRVSWVVSQDLPCMAEVSVLRMDGEVSPIYGFGNATDKDTRVQRSWVAHPEFIVLSKFAELDVKSVYIGHEYSRVMPDIPEPVREFLADKISEYSWSAGVVAETLWRAAALSEEKSKAGALREGEDRAHTSWQGAWFKSADKSSMFLTSMKLTEMGYTVVSYGLGWVRCMVMEEDIPELINDGMTMGLLPQLVDVPEGFYQENQPVPWGGDKRSSMLAQFTLTRQKNLLWSMDKVPIIPYDKREEYLRKLKQMMVASTRRR